MEKPATPRLIVLTGGPGGGKTAVLELARHNFCEHVAVLPEAASVIFGGGFWRRDTFSAKRAAQRAIYHVQHEMERLAIEDGKYSVILCDRGALDGLAYWPGDPQDYFRELRTNEAEELSRYDSIIHLRTPAAGQGYNHQNPVRTETALEAAAVDQRIEKVWRQHPSRVFIESSVDFLSKAAMALSQIRSHLPDSCKGHYPAGATNAGIASGP